ncbi:MAG: DUF3179 domain-containing protein [Nitrospinae bacterium]|nr:DUF3179 domain-containing protein [Nitrospinota bacterium]
MPQMRSVLLALVILASPVLSGASPETEIRTLLPKDGIPAIDAPEYVGAKDAEGFMQPDEMVIGINIKGDKRAYSVPLLSSHEIVNDVVGGSAVSVTW